MSGSEKLHLDKMSEICYNIYRRCENTEDKVGPAMRAEGENDMRTVKHTEGLQPIPFEEAVPLITKYVGYFFRSGKFYSLAASYECEDLVQEVCLKWLTNGYLDMFSPKVTSKPYFIMSGVKNFMVDKLRSQKLCLSLDAEDKETGLTLGERLEDYGSSIEKGIENMMLEEMLEELPDETDSKIIVISPLSGGECKATLRLLARLLAAGYTQAECRKFFLNPKTRQPVTSGRISQMVNEIRDIYTLCGYC